jgi:hypothetical protein
MDRIFLPDFMASITEYNLFVHRHRTSNRKANELLYRQSSNKHTQLIKLLVKVSLKDYQKQPGGITFQLATNVTPPLNMQTINFLILLLLCQFDSVTYQVTSSLLQITQGLKTERHQISNKP